MLRGSKGPVIQIDRLIFDTRYKRKIDPIPPDLSSSLNKTNKEILSNESYFYIPSNKLQITRLTLEDLNKDEKQIYSMGQQPLSILETTIEQQYELIHSPVYESIDERRDSIDLIKKRNST